MLRSIGKQSGESVESEVTQKPATWHKIAWQVGYSTKSVITGKSTTESMLSPQNSTKQCRHVFNRAYRSRTGTLFLTLRSSSWISTASEQHKDSCVCGAVGTRSALEALRLYLGCVRLCALQIDIYNLYIIRYCETKSYPYQLLSISIFFLPLVPRQMAK